MGQLQGQDEDSGKSEATVSATLWSDFLSKYRSRVSNTLSNTNAKHFYIFW